MLIFNLINKNNLVKITFIINNPQIPTTNRMLNIAEPTTALKPGSDSDKKTPTSEINTSGAELPTAINVAPETS